MGSDFVPIKKRLFPNCYPGFEKFQIRDLLKCYDAVLWIDNDAVVLKGAPSLFEIVPQGTFAACEEDSRDEDLKVVARAIGLPYVSDRPFGYFNSGVFVTWRGHEKVFEDHPPGTENVTVFADQSFLNVRVAHLRLPFLKLDPRWNALPCYPWIKDPYIVHYAGLSKDDNFVDRMRGTIKDIL